jgi:hypothetical protein
VSEKTLVRLYDRLTPRERFELLLGALDREDDTELDRLRRTCPTKTYTMNDAIYTDLVEASERIAFLFTILWLDLLARVKQADSALASFRLASLMYERGFNAGLSQAKRIPRKGDPIWQRYESDMSRLKANCHGAEVSRRQGIGVLKAVHAALTRFCRTIGIERDKILVFSKPILGQLQNAEPLLAEDIPCDAVIDETTYTKLMSLWPSSQRPTNL